MGFSGLDCAGLRAAIPRCIHLALLVCLIAAAASQAIANPSSISIEVTGTVEPRCLNTGFDAPLRIQDVASAGTDTIAFNVNCNAPFQYSLDSQNGALTLDGAAHPDGNMAGEVLYTVLIRIPLNSGPAIDDVRASRAIKAGAAVRHFTNSRNAVAIDKPGQMTISWEPGSKRLMAGAYQDRLTMKLSIRP